MKEEPDPQETAEAEEVRALMRDISMERSGDEFWRRLFSRHKDSLFSASDVSRMEVPAYAATIWFSEEFKQDWLKNLVLDNLVLRISIGRQGRKEAVQALTGITERKARLSLLRMRRSNP